MNSSLDDMTTLLSLWGLKATLTTLFLATRATAARRALHHGYVLAAQLRRPCRVEFFGVYFYDIFEMVFFRCFLVHFVHFVFLCDLMWFICFTFREVESFCLPSSAGGGCLTSWAVAWHAWHETHETKWLFFHAIIEDVMHIKTWV